MPAPPPATSGPAVARVRRVEALHRGLDGAVTLEGPYLEAAGEGYRLGGLYLAEDPVAPDGPLYILFRIESADTQSVVAACPVAHGLEPILGDVEAELRRGWLRTGSLAVYTTDELEHELQRRRGERPGAAPPPVQLARVITRSIKGELYRRGYHQRLELPAVAGGPAGAGGSAGAQAEGDRP